MVQNVNQCETRNLEDVRLMLATACSLQVRPDLNLDQSRLSTPLSSPFLYRFAIKTILSTEWKKNEFESRFCFKLRSGCTCSWYQSDVFEISGRKLALVQILDHKNPHFTAFLFKLSEFATKIRNYPLTFIFSQTYHALAMVNWSKSGFIIKNNCFKPC